MLQIFDEFRKILDDIMLKAMHKRVVLYGYGYTGRFLEWYADYYHSIKIDFIITQDAQGGVLNNYPLFMDSLFEFDYMDVKDAIVWMAVPKEERITEKLERAGYIKNQTYFDFYEAVYGKEFIFKKQIRGGGIYDIIHKEIMDIQFMEWLEYVYDCDFITAIDSFRFVNGKKGAYSYRMSAQKEIFPILDRCHCVPGEDDAIFDFGCGKGAPMVSFLDYGFRKVGGVEYEKIIYDVMIDNFQKLGINLERNKTVSCIHGDAMALEKELDGYNWFYYFAPFGKEVFEKTIVHICESMQRRPRKVHIININPQFHSIILDSGFFVLNNQFTVATRQKVVDVFVSKREYE